MTGDALGDAIDALSRLLLEEDEQPREVHVAWRLLTRAYVERAAVRMAELEP